VHVTTSEQPPETARKVATVLSVVTKTTAEAERIVTALLKPVAAGEPPAAGGWVLVTAGDEVLAQVHVRNGQATCSLPPEATGQVMVSYTGDERLAPSQRTIEI
jgi:hypothetical protein